MASPFHKRQSRGARPKIVHAKKAVKAMALRLQGKRYAEIGEALGISEQHAWRLVMKELDILNTKRLESAEKVQRLELERMDELMAGIFPKAKQGNLAAIDRVLGIMQRRAKLLGLDLGDKPLGQGNATVVLNVNEVIVDRGELTNGNRNAAALENGATAPGARGLPSK